MAEHPRVLIVGGSGVFGRVLAHELLRTTSVELILAGRGLSAAIAACRELGAPDRTSAIALDLGDRESLTRAARGCVAVACAAGPFQELSRELPMAAVRAAAHWLDIGDHEGWVVPVLDDATLDAAARDAGSAVIPGLSTVPALSGALARWGCERLPGADRARITLFIGNRNVKGAGAIASAMSNGFRRPTRVDRPFGRRIAYVGRSPDTELLRRDLGLDAEFRVVLEWAPAGLLVFGLGPVWSRLGARSRSRGARILATISRPFGRFGSEGGCLQVDLWDGKRRLSVTALSDDQRLGILPCAMALQRLLEGDLPERGVLHPAAWLSPRTGIGELVARGVRLVTVPSAEPAHPAAEGLPLDPE
jgi:NAD(P)-dependent dehydrogenase (short-subunit alcohol dehydrogenase family)